MSLSRLKKDKPDWKRPTHFEEPMQTQLIDRYAHMDVKLVVSDPDLIQKQPCRLRQLFLSSPRDKIRVDLRIRMVKEVRTL